MIDFRLQEKRRRRLDSEEGAIFKKGADLSVVLVYPNVYSVGMGNLGFQAVYGYLNGIDGVGCERAFLPDAEDAPLFAKHQTHLFTLESERPLTEFDLVAFSIAFEDDYLNLPTLFRLARIPLRAADRGDDHPLVLGGGMCVFMNPEPLSAVMDVLFLGEVEAGFSRLIGTLRDRKSRRESKPDLLDACLDIPGVYVPSRYEVVYDERNWVARRRPVNGAPATILKQRVDDLDRAPTRSVVHAPESEFGSMHLVEVTRGCGWRCRFCAEGYVYLPPRMHNPDKILASLPEPDGKRKIGLVGTSLPEHPELARILAGASLDQRTVCTASIRLDGANREILAKMSEGAQKTLTIAPEAGNERMRRIINKPISDRALIRSVDTALETGIKNIKLYYIVGLPFEEEEDMRDIVRLSEQVWDRIDQKSRFPDSKLTLSINPFIPKPSTPFQWCGLKSETFLRGRVGLIKEGLNHLPRVRVSGYSPRQAVLQTLFSIGDRRVGAMLASKDGLHPKQITAARKASEIFAEGAEGAMSPAEGRRSWTAAFENLAFIVHRDKDVNESLPWDFVDHGIQKSFLIDEWRRAEATVRTRACHVPTCTICGICGHGGPRSVGAESDPARGGVPPGLPA